MGMSGLVKPGDKPGESSKGGSQAATEPTAGVVKRPTAVGWTGFGRSGNAEQRKKGDDTEAVDQNEDEDRGIRFTISGAGRRMTKDDFLKEIQKLERSNREVPNELITPKDAPGTSAAEPPTASEQANSPDLENPHISVTQASDSTRAASKSPARSDNASRGRSGTRDNEDVPSTEPPETAAERRRRLAAFASVQDDDSNETPAERRRREAALGVTGPSSEESDSDDDDTPRVPPERRGIRFAEGPAKRA